MQWPNTNSTPNKPVTLLRNKLLILYVVTSPVHTVTIRCYGTRKHYKFVPTLKDLNIFCVVFVSLMKIESGKATVFLWAQIMLHLCMSCDTLQCLDGKDHLGQDHVLT